jgi:hypothetical protein
MKPFTKVIIALTFVSIACSDISTDIILGDNKLRVVDNPPKVDIITSKVNGTVFISAINTLQNYIINNTDYQGSSENKFRVELNRHSSALTVYMNDNQLHELFNLFNSKLYRFKMTGLTFSPQTGLLQQNWKTNERKFGYYLRLLTDQFVIAKNLKETIKIPPAETNFVAAVGYAKELLIKQTINRFIFSGETFYRKNAKEIKIAVDLINGLGLIDGWKVFLPRLFEMKTAILYFTLADDLAKNFTPIKIEEYQDLLRENKILKW